MIEHEKMQALLRAISAFKGSNVEGLDELIYAGFSFFSSNGADIEADVLELQFSEDT